MTRSGPSLSGWAGWATLSGWAVPWANLRGDLAMAMTMNPGLHVLVQ